MQDERFPAATPEMSRKRASLAPASTEAFRVFNRQVFAEEALPRKDKQLIAVAVAHVTQCPYCIRGHTKQAGGATWSDPGRAEGGGLGGGRDASRCRLRAQRPGG